MHLDNYNVKARRGWKTSKLGGKTSDADVWDYVLVGQHTAVGR